MPLDLQHPLLTIGIELYQLGVHMRGKIIVKVTSQTYIITTVIKVEFFSICCQIKREKLLLLFSPL